MSVDLANLRRRNDGRGAALRWHVGDFLIRHPWILNLLGVRLTILDAFGAPGDTLLTAIICRHVKQHYPRIRLNLLTPNPELVQRDPVLNEINQPESYVCLWHWYLDVIERKDGGVNVLEPTFSRLGIDDYEYRARVFLAEEELAAQRKRLDGLRRPVITINIMSREAVKNWPLTHWQTLVREMGKFATIVQLGDGREPEIEGVLRLAGSLSMRESMAVIAHADLHVGTVSFLMHAANGVNTPAVIIYGGRETPQNSGYKQNRNLYGKVECSPCWIHENRGERCLYDVKCMKLIAPETVAGAVEDMLKIPDG